MPQKADHYYKEHPRIDAKVTYDFDWFVRFFEAAGNVSGDTMQNLWAKILAGEIAQPSSFSLKTIDVMRNLSKKDAELFIKICSHSFMSSEINYFLPNENEYLESVDITYTDIMKLNEVGLISLNMNISNEPQILINSPSLLMMISSSFGKPEEATISQYPFTEAGKELSTLISESASEEDFLKYGKVLSHNENYQIFVYRIIKWEGTFVRYEKKI